jgi:hypothetical protein
MLNSSKKVEIEETDASEKTMKEIAWTPEEDCKTVSMKQRLSSTGVFQHLGTPEPDLQPSAVSPNLIA